MTSNVCHALHLRTGAIFTQVWSRATSVFLTYNVLLLIHYVTLWPWPLTPWPWTFVVYRLSCGRTPYQIWANSNKPRLNFWRFNQLSRPFIVGQFLTMRSLDLRCVASGMFLTTRCLAVWVSKKGKNSSKTESLPQMSGSIINRPH